MGEWISVKDRLPEVRFREHIPCLVRIQKVCGGFLTDYYETEIANYTSSMMAFSHYFDGMKTQGIVTHWMALPEPPISD